MRNKSFRRDMRNRKIAHRKKICKHVYGMDWYKHDGMYAKGKIHCSCKMCTWSKSFDLPSLKDEIEKERVKDMLEDLYSA